MQLFYSTLGQMGFLFTLIVIGYAVAAAGVLPKEAARVLSKLESYIFIPALVMGTFLSNFTRQKLAASSAYFLVGAVVVLISAPLAILFARICSRDGYIRKIYTYGLAFSNFGFMGNAVVSALFPEIFFEYLIYVLPFWILIYLWGVPVLLIPADVNGELSVGRKSLGKRLLGRLRAFANPMLISMLIGILIGLLSIPVPEFLSSAISSLGACMSPVAMLLTGITVAGIDLKKARTVFSPSVFILSVIRLIAFPAVFLALLWALRTLTSFEMSYGVALCTTAALAMPLGLNTIVIPGAYGKDTSVAAGMALVSHLLSCITIPLVFLLFERIIGGGM